MKKIIFILILIMCLTGCGNSIVGKYKLVQMVEEGEEISQETIENMDIEFEITSDTEAILKTLGIEQRFKIQNNMLIDTNDIKENNVETEIGIPFSVSGKTITIRNDTDKMVFEKK